MPTYEYVCRSCDTHLEVVQRFDDEPLTECPACGGSLRKVFGSIGIAFKGSGFYKNDSRSVAKTGTGAPAKADAKGDGNGAKDGAKDGAKEGAGEGSGSSKAGSDGGKDGAGSSGGSSSKESSGSVAAKSSDGASSSPAAKTA